MRAPIISLIALLVISGFSQASLYQITDVQPRYAGQFDRNILLVTVQNVDTKPGTMVRAVIQSRTSGITFTGSYDNLGFIDWMDTRTASFPYLVSNVPDGNYPLYLTVYDGSSTTDFTFNFTISRTNPRIGTVCGDGICEGAETSGNCPRDCAGGAAANGTNATGPFALPGSTCDIFRVDSISLKDKPDGRINPTDKFNLGIYLHSTTTTTIFETKAFITEDNPNIIVPGDEISYITFGDRATIPAYFPMETRDVTPGQYGMVLRTTYVKDGRECLQLIPFNITVEGGYAFSLDLRPDSIEASPGSQISLRAHIRNLGTRDDTYDLTFRGVSEWVQQADRTVFVKAGQDKDAIIKLYVPPVTGLYELSAIAKSRTLSVISNRDTTLITVSEPVKPIHAINLLVVDSRSIDVARGEGGQFKIKVQNAGTIKDTISLAATGVDWAYLKPDTLTLQPGEIADLSMYVAPTADTSIGTYAIKIKASAVGGEATAEETVSVYVAEKKTTVTPPGTGAAGGANATGLTGFVLLAKGAATYGGGLPLVFATLLLICILIGLSAKKEKPEELRPLKGN